MKRTAALLLGMFFVGALAAAQTVLMVVHKQGDSVGFYDADSGKGLATVPVGKRPHEQAFTADGRFAFVTNYGLDRWTEPAPGGNTLTIIDTQTRRAVGEVDLGRYRRPHGIQRGARSGLLYVTCDLPPAVIAVDPVRREVVKAWAVDRQEGPHMLEVTRDERWIWVANSSTATVSRIDTSSGEQVHVPVGGIPMGLAMARDEKTVWACNRVGETVFAIDAATAKVRGKVEVKGQPVRLHAADQDRLLLVTTIGSGELVWLDAKTLREVRRAPVGGAAEGLLVHGAHVYATAQADNKLKKFEAATGREVLTMATGKRPDTPLVVQAPGARR